MFKYSYDSLVYFGEPVERSIQRLAKFGYDAIELVGEPDNYRPAEVTKLTGDHGIKVSSICSIFTIERDLASPDAKVRQHAVDYVRRVTDLAAAVSGDQFSRYETAEPSGKCEQLGPSIRIKVDRFVILEGLICGTANSNRLLIVSARPDFGS